jgi:hypothetical protein
MSVHAIILNTNAWFKRSPNVFNAEKGNLPFLLKWRNRQSHTHQATFPLVQPSTRLSSLTPMTHRRARTITDKHYRRYPRAITICSIARCASAFISIQILSNQAYAGSVGNLDSVEGGGLRAMFKQVISACTLSTSKHLALPPETRCFNTFAQSRNAYINFMSVMNTILTRSWCSGLACGRCRIKYNPGYKYCNGGRLY